MEDNNILAGLDVILVVALFIIIFCLPFISLLLGEKDLEIKE